MLNKMLRTVADRKTERVRVYSMIYKTLKNMLHITDILHIHDQVVKRNYLVLLSVSQGKVRATLARCHYLGNMGTGLSLFRAC